MLDYPPGPGRANLVLRLIIATLWTLLLVLVRLTWLGSSDGSSHDVSRLVYLVPALALNIAITVIYTLYKRFDRRDRSNHFLRTHAFTQGHTAAILELVLYLLLWLVVLVYYNAVNVALDAQHQLYRGWHFCPNHIPVPVWTDPSSAQAELSVVYPFACSFQERFLYTHDLQLRHVPLYDATLLQLDNQLLGQLWPLGQVSLYIDRLALGNSGHVNNAMIRLVYEILQLFYMSFYVWGFVGLLALLALNAGLEWLTRDRDTNLIITDALAKQRHQQLKRYLRRLLLLALNAWLGGFLCTFCMHLLYPTISPRLYLQHQYRYPIEGLWAFEWFQSIVASAAKHTYSAFPSSHCGMSWVIPVMAHRLKCYKMRNALIVIAILISMSTLVLRYHYFADFVFGMLPAMIGLFLGGFHSDAAFEHSMAGVWT